MPRGGRRKGREGRQYSNRQDLQMGPRAPIARIPGQEYGAQARQVEAQRQLPIRKAAPAQTASPIPFRGQDPIPLDAPTMRPDEPLTAGVNVGPGPGAPAPVMQMTDDPVIQKLRALYIAFPSEDLRELLEDHDTGRTF